MYTIPIFENERKAGFSSADLSKASISYLTKLELNASPTELIKSESAKIPTINVPDIKVDQPDLNYLKAILVTTNWNDNDEVFLPQEVYPARYTNNNKQLNLGHDCNEIIGHSFASNTVDDSGQLIADDLTLDTLPEKFHVVSHSVIYNYWSKKEKQELINKVIKEIPEGKWFVSVEALFPNFDYLTRSQNGEFKLVYRNENTSWMTKHLRIYGGKGEYEGYMIGRVPRNIVLSGQGIVEQPANPQSFILSLAKQTSFNQLVYKEELTQKSKNGELIKMEQDKIVADLKAELAQLTAKLAEKDTKKIEAELVSLQASLTAKNAEIENLNKSVVTKDEAFSKLQADFAGIAEKAKLITEELEKAKAEKKLAVRLNEVQAKLGYSKEDSDIYVQTVASLSDEQFAKNIEFQAAKIAKQAEVAKTNVNKPDEKVLENLKAEKDVTLGNVAGDEGVKKLEQTRNKIVNALQAGRKAVEKKEVK